MAKTRKLSSENEESQTPKKPEPENYEEEEEEEEVEEVEESEDDEEKEDEEEEEEEDDEEYEENEEESEDLSDRETLRKLLEPFSKEQLMDLLKDSALKNPTLFSRISESAESDPSHRKIFVHGLGWDCTTPALTAAFSPFGDIEECKVVLDRTTGRSKGYGFVLFRSRYSALKALRDPQKVIGGRSTSCQLASFGASKGNNNGNPDATGRKVFVSNIGASVTPERLREFFAKFGEIEEGPLGYDKASGKLRRFAIFVYRTVEGCRKALEEPMKVFEGCELKCQRALEGLKPVPATTQTMGGFGGVGVGVGVGGGLFQANDLASAYASQPMVGMIPAAGLLSSRLVGQSSGGGAGVGLLNSVAGISPSLNRSVTPTSYGIGTGVNSVSPSVIGSYQSQAALQGLGAYQSSQLSSIPESRNQPGVGSYPTGFSPYFGR